MNGIDKILDKLQAESQAETAAILEKARAEAEAIAARFARQAEQEKAAAEVKGRKAAEERQDRLIRAAEMESKKTILGAKQAVLDKALEGFVGSKVEPAALLATQVVAGTNYCFLCRVTPVVPNAQSAWCLVYVYHALDGSARILEFQDVTLGLSAAE